MNVKTAITLILGLVFQLAQVLPGAVVTPPCHKLAESCACCMAGRPCHCAENGEPDQKPPLTPPNSGTVLKIPVVKPSETMVFAKGPLDPQTPAPAAAAPFAGPARGYTGVRLSVAFCSFVI